MRQSVPLGEGGICGLVWGLSEFFALRQASTCLADRHREKLQGWWEQSRTYCIQGD